MAPRTIISYDGTSNDRDALMLGRLFADAGAELTLAYVRHNAESQRAREELAEHEAEALLAQGAELLNDLEIARRVVISASTAEGLRWLGEHEDADMIVFGSEYRTAIGHIAPQRSTQTLLEGGPLAVAIAPANYAGQRGEQVRSIGVLGADEAVIETARNLASQLDAHVVNDQRHVDLLVVGSRAEAAEGRVLLSSQAQNEIENATCPVLVVARGVPIHFGLSLAFS